MFYQYPKITTLPHIYKQYLLFIFRLILNLLYYIIFILFFFTNSHKVIDKYPDKYPDFDSESASIAFKRTFALNGVLISLVFPLFRKKNKNAKITFFSKYI